MLKLQLLSIVSVVCCFKLAIGDCNDITFDYCGTDQTIPFETFTDQGEVICQQICREVYAGRCIFFIYNREDELCELYDIDEQIYADSCKRITGTPQPSLAECKESNDPCTVRHQLQQSDIILDPVKKLYQKLSFLQLILFSSFF